MREPMEACILLACLQAAGRLNKGRGAVRSVKRQNQDVNRTSMSSVLTADSSGTKSIRLSRSSSCEACRWQRVM